MTAISEGSQLRLVDKSIHFSRSSSVELVTVPYSQTRFLIENQNDDVQTL